jgi:hypothetical protein
VRRDYSSPTARALRRPRRAPRLLVSGRTRSTPTSLCTATTRLRLHALYVDLAVHRDYSSSAARALRQPRRAPRVLVSTLPAAVIYLDYAARPGASARRAARRVARRATRRRLLRLRRASGCLGTSRGPSRGSSSTTPCAATSSCGHAGSTLATPCVVTTCLAATLALLRVHRASP